MTTIWKFEVPQLPGVYGIRMPHGANVLSAGLAQNKSVIWAEVNPDAERVYRKIAVIWTGGEAAPDGYTFVGTVVTHEGDLVQHVYVESVSP